MPSFMISLLAWGSDSSSLLSHLMNLKGHQYPLPDFAAEYHNAVQRLDTAARKLNKTWFPSNDPSKCERHVEVANDLELAAALDLLQRSNWCGSPMYFLGGDDRQLEIVSMDENLEKRWKTICSDEGVWFESGVIHMEPMPFPAQYLKRFQEVSDDILAYEIFQSLLKLEVVEVNSVDQVTFVNQLSEIEPDWNFELSVLNETERQAIEEMAEEYNLVVRRD